MSPTQSRCLRKTILTLPRMGMAQVAQRTSQIAPATVPPVGALAVPLLPMHPTQGKRLPLLFHPRVFSHVWPTMTQEYLTRQPGHLVPTVSFKHRTRQWSWGPLYPLVSTVLASLYSGPFHPAMQPMRHPLLHIPWMAAPLLQLQSRWPPPPSLTSHSSRYLGSPRDQRIRLSST